MREGGVGVALSVLYSFFDEVDLSDGAHPEPGYPATIARQLATVEGEVRRDHRGEAAVARNPAELVAAIEADRVALVHCVEGGFHLGATPGQVDRSVTRLAQRGVAYITLAHLIWREVATNSPALPFLTEEQYHRYLPQPDVGLSDLGRAAVEAMTRERVLIDVAHMSERALDDTFGLLEAKPGKVPVFATHAGYRFGTQSYMLDRPVLERIAARDGVVGLIFAQHQLYDGLSAGTLRRHGLRVRKGKRFDESFEVLCHHIDCIGDATGSHRHTAIGSDFDGFIKPTLAGLQDMRDMERLEERLRERYGDEDAERICSGNALRLLTSYWRGASLDE
jgi:microsomal dipeptidase-like Zn-dependent dipeptidase